MFIQECLKSTTLYADNEATDGFCVLNIFFAASNCLPPMIFVDAKSCSFTFLKPGPRETHFVISPLQEVCDPSQGSAVSVQKGPDKFGETSPLLD